MIFVDTSFWVGIRNRRDSSHDLARSLLAKHAAEPLLTSNHVRGETWTFLRRRAGHRSAVDFLESVDHSPRLRIVFVSEDIETAALRWLRRHDEREYSFVDATSFALMRSLRVRDVLSFDGDFTAAGFRELRD
ncbi:MAG TPA: PIN domain-containing protein [Candidatus Dormibacteraeota bacterium]|nr:PIN domain-containing protein [Candidatus Dormibacteraeota bacterium]